MAVLIIVMLVALTTVSVNCDCLDLGCGITLYMTGLNQMWNLAPGPNSTEIVNNDTCFGDTPRGFIATVCVDAAAAPMLRCLDQQRILVLKPPSAVGTIEITAACDYDFY